MGGWGVSAGSGAAYVNKGELEGIGFEGPWFIRGGGVQVVPWSLPQMPPPSRQPGTLSNGTLSLKFMQRALIAENKAPVEAAKAEIADDSKWFIDPTAQQATQDEIQSL